MEKTRNFCKVLILAALMTIMGAFAASAAIPGGASVYNGHSYKLYDKASTWTEAQAYCKKMGGNLVSISTPGEQAFVKKLLANGKKNVYWTGGVRKYPNTYTNEWYWVDGSPFSYYNWCGGSSDQGNSDGFQNYICIYNSTAFAYFNYQIGTWETIREDGGFDIMDSAFWGKENFGFICEWNSKESSSASASTVKTKSLAAPKYNYIVACKGKVILKLKPVKGATSYQVQYSTSKFFTSAQTKTSKKLFYSLNFKMGRKYYIRVRALKAGKRSAWSSTICIRLRKKSGSFIRADIFFL